MTPREKAAVDALRNMAGAFDTPVERRRRPLNDFQEEAVQSMRAVLEAYDSTPHPPSTVEQEKDEAGLLRAAIHHMALMLSDFGRHEAECVCSGDQTPHAANCKDCDCGLREAVEFGVEQSGLSLEPPEASPEEIERLNARGVEIVEQLLAKQHATVEQEGRVDLNKLPMDIATHMLRDYEHDELVLTEGDVADYLKAALAPTFAEVRALREENVRLDAKWTNALDDVRGKEESLSYYRKENLKAEAELAALRARVTVLEEALRTCKQTIEIVLGGQSVIASMALSGAVDTIDAALTPPVPPAEKREETQECPGCDSRPCRCRELHETNCVWMMTRIEPCDCALAEDVDPPEPTPQPKMPEREK